MSFLSGSTAVRQTTGEQTQAQQSVPSTPVRPDSSGTTGTALARARRAPVLGELLVVLLLLRAYDLIRGHAEVRQAAALAHGWQLLHTERWLHVNMELSINHWASAHTALSLAASYWYQFLHITITLCVLVWCWWKRPESYRRARNALVLTNVFGLAFFLIYPAAPPRFLPGAGYIDAVAQAGFGTTHGGPVTADQYGAFPSLHLAWAVWTAVVAYRLVRPTWLRRLWLGYPLITATVVMATGNHYLLDVVAGVFIALGTLMIAHRYPRSREYGKSPHRWALTRGVDTAIRMKLGRPARSSSRQSYWHRLRPDQLLRASRSRR